MVDRPRVLVVEDDDFIRALVAEALTDEGYETREASDGQQGLAVLEGTWRPDLILLDWNMPVMNGIEFIAALRRLAGGAEPKVVFCTTENDVAHIREAIEAGADEYVMKPFDHETLQMKLQLIGAA